MMNVEELHLLEKELNVLDEKARELFLSANENEKMIIVNLRRSFQISLHYTAALAGPLNLTEKEKISLPIINDKKTETVIETVTIPNPIPFDKRSLSIGPVPVVKNNLLRQIKKIIHRWTA